ncbi:hypothetical protein HELRODRAFT_107575 [Helobdella robusta]|uniref:Ribosome biogenesis protein WDR12 homolog n=1 Tax=Helobdella robusta TaxID=6412 RepID=T1EEB4_HELRO|nr:hypothetical protein HELRODRAFT_107575 [Helobdella robusta]ESN96548.1 hypothetical protein HELRODRAFT_107575 [Helobdella robusta]
MDDFAEKKLQVKFVTKQLKYAIPDVPISLPENVSTKELNNLINQLLFPDQSADVYVNFDFLINDELLRQSLIEHVTEKEIQIEDTIVIEYVDKLPAPSVGECLMHNDWIAAVKAHHDNLILTGCYDGSIGLWRTSGEMLMMVRGHEAAVKSVAWLQDVGQEKRFVSGSDDGTCVMWSLNIHNINNNNNNNSNNNNNNNNVLNCGFLKKLHTCPMPELSPDSANATKPQNVQCVAANSDKTLFASGSWDCVVNIWSAIPNLGESQTNVQLIDDGRKKRRVDCQSVEASIRLPVQTFEGPEVGHKGQVTSVDWLDSSKVCSSSWDHSIKLWDVHAGRMTSSIVGSKVFFDLSYSPLNNLIVAASADRHVRLYDPRITSGSVVKNTFTSHTGWVSSVHWSPEQEHLFMSGAYDCVTKLWDIRSPKASLYDMRGHEDKILCCDWSIANDLISGGADKQLKIFHKNNDRLAD